MPIDGYLIPGSISSSYVANKRTEEGSFQYDTAANRIGIQKQSALQNLGSTYATTIENAYASYLASQRGIMGSNLGQGYKEAYLQNQQRELMANIADTNLNVANIRAELSAQEAAAKEEVSKQFTAEVGNIDRVAKSFENYLGYLKSLSKDGKSYLSSEQTKMPVDDLYETLYGAQPQNLLDSEGNMGLPYSQWVNSQLTTSTVDTAWGQWFNQGGVLDFLKAVQERDYKTTEEKIVQEVGNQTSEYQKALSDYNMLKNNYENFSGAKYASVRTPGRHGTSKQVKTQAYINAEKAYLEAQSNLPKLYEKAIKAINTSSLNESIKKQLIEELQIK